MGIYDCPNCNSNTSLHVRWFPEGLLIQQCEVCLRTIREVMLLQDVIERYELTIIKTDSGWMAGLLTDAFGQKEAYVDTSTGQVEGWIEAFAEDSTVTAAVQKSISLIARKARQRFLQSRGG